MSMQYVTGGTMLAQSVSYVVRDADHKLTEQLVLGQFCYVLTPRQMGKSSLMVRTAATLRERGIASASIDLSSQGYSLSADQWYAGLLDTLAERLDLEDEMEAYCAAHANLSPLQLWRRALRHVVLANIAGPVVVFLDEIDITRRLNIETDELFAAIRSCYNERATDPAYQRLTFCLLGVATPTDLIRDPTITPFNIGTKIDLRDFTYEEASVLRYGLGRSEVMAHQLMRRIYHWTEGHPYLTQRLCKAVALDKRIGSVGGVDRMCQEIFLDSKAGMSDDNLAFVRQRLAPANESERSTLLTRYDQVLRGSRVSDDENLPAVSQLKLSGAVKPRDGYLISRNPIYSTVFNAKWTRENMPGDELRRQRAAYRTGIIRAWSRSAAVIIAVSFLALYAFQQKHIKEALAESERKFEDAYGHLGALFYHNEHNPYKTLKVLMSTRPKAGEVDTRSFMWRWLWHESNQDSAFLADPNDQLILAVAVSPDGRYLATGGQAKTGNDSTVWIWDLYSSLPPTPLAYPGEVKYLAFALSGKLLVAAGGRTGLYSEPGVIRRWSVPGFVQRNLDLLDPHAEIQKAAISSDGASLASASSYSANVWNIAVNSPTATAIQVENCSCIAISKEWTVISSAGRIRLTENRSPQNKIPDVTWSYTSREAEDAVSLAFSPDGKLLVSGHENGMVRIWDLRSRKCISEMKHPAPVVSVAFSPDGDMIATACWDSHVRLWNVANAELIRDYVGHLSLVNSVAFVRLSRPDESAPGSPASTSNKPKQSGLFVVSGSNDGTTRFWSAETRLLPPLMSKLREPVQSVVMSAGNEPLAITSLNEKTRLRVFRNNRTLAPLIAGANPIVAAAYAPANLGSILALLDSAGIVHIVRSQTYSPIHQFEGLSLKQLMSISNYSLTYSPDGRYLAVQGKAVAIWNTHNYRRLATLPLNHLHDVALMTMSPDGNTIVTAGKDIEPKNFGDGSIEIWDVRNPAMPIEAGCIRGAHSNNNIKAMVVSPENKTLATAGWDQHVRLWDLADCKGEIDGRKVHLDNVLQVRAGPINCVAFTPDCKEIYIGNSDSTISVWDLNSEPPVEHGVLSGHNGPVTDLRFIDDDTLVSSSEDMTVRYWRATSKALLDDPVRVDWLKRKLK